MAGLLDESMVFKNKKSDSPTKPYFSNVSEPTKIKSSLNETTKVVSDYRPASIPPKLKQDNKSKTNSVEVSDIKTGMKVIHKAFGEGVVLKIKRNIITVNFNGSEKKFEIPTAFQNGFLRKL